MKRETPIASIHIHRAWAMTPRQRKEVAVWLMEQGKELSKEGFNYATRFVSAFYWDHKVKRAERHHEMQTD
jgi:predicted metal-binding protein